jgi:hypothetical protein
MSITALFVREEDESDHRSQVLFGAPNYRGHYGDAYRLGFPMYLRNLQCNSVYAVPRIAPLQMEKPAEKVLLVGDAYSQLFLVYPLSNKNTIV